MAGLGLPSVLRMVERSRLTGAAKELQAELNRTRLASMKSGEPLVFHFELGTGNYEIMSKQEYDLRFPPQPIPQLSFPPEQGMFGGMMSPDMMMSGAGQPQQAAGSTGPSLSDRGGASLADLAARQPPSSLSDRGNASSLADLGPPPSFADRFGEPDLQQIAAIPVSKFLPVYKTLPHNLRLQESGNRLQASDFGFQTSDFGLQGSGFSEARSPVPDASFFPEAPRFSEPIFFFPNGRTSNARFSVCSTTGKGYYINVSMRGLTGTARLGDLEVLP
jgi:hypothetical protein